VADKLVTDEQDGASRTMSGELTVPADWLQQPGPNRDKDAGRSGHAGRARQEG
jgi:hypothetical protein